MAISFKTPALAAVATPVVVPELVTHTGKKFAPATSTPGVTVHTPKHEVQQVQEVKQVQAPAAKKLAVTDQQLKVDELIQIETFLQEHEIDLMMKRREEIRKVLQSIANESDPSEDVQLDGTLGHALFAKASQVVSIVDKEGIIEAITPEIFMQLAKVTVTDLKKYLSEIELDKYTKKTMGSRVFKGVTKTAIDD